MRSYDHVISGTFISTVVVSTTVHLVTSDNEIMVKAGNIIKEVFIPNDMSWILTLLYVVGGSILLWIGMMFPDCDHPNSRIGRVFHIPVAHRTWTHAIWIPAMLAVAAYWCPLVSWFILGYMEHLWCDDLSADKICWFYPIGKNSRKRGLRLYHTGEVSETVVMVMICVICGIADYLLLFGNSTPAAVVQSWMSRSA